MIKGLFVGFFILFGAIQCLAQEQGEEKTFRKKAVKYEEIIIDSNIYRTNASWITFSTGQSINFKDNTLEPNFSTDVHLRANEYIFGAGYHLTTHEFLIRGDASTFSSFQKLNNFHLTLGVRRESKKSNLIIFGGPAYCYGYSYHHTDTAGVVYFQGFSSAGIYAAIDYTYKIFYDLGVGLTFFGSYSGKYPVIGLQAHVYFSNAFRGKIKK